MAPASHRETEISLRWAMQEWRWDLVASALARDSGMIHNVESPGPISGLLPDEMGIPWIVAILWAA
jgi:hypothetical protein